MARSIRDNMKRSCAQAVNSMAGAILSINEVHDAFKEHHPEDAEILKQIMIGQNMVRDAVLKWVEKTWALDEDTLQSYL